MKNKLLLLDDILYKELRPWLPENNPDEKYASMVSEVKAVEPSFPMRYQLEFPRAFNFKTKYYQKLVTREMNKYCNRVLTLIAEEDNDMVRKFWINDTLNKKLKSALKEVGKLIKEKQLDMTYIDPSKSTFDMDTAHKTDTYIIQLLKCALIKIYLEIQHAFKDYCPDEMVIEDFYMQLLFEHIPIDSFIKEIPPDIVIEPTWSEAEQPVFQDIKESKESEIYTNVDFIPRQSDFRGAGPSPVSYAAIRNVDAFTQFEKELFESKIINEQYEFQKKRGNKEILAALYKILIQKNYFLKKNFKRKSSFEEFHYRQYLDYRYQVDTSQQFRKCTQEDIEKFKYKYRWIENIDYCR